VGRARSRYLRPSGPEDARHALMADLEALPPAWRLKSPSADFLAPARRSSPGSPTAPPRGDQFPAFAAPVAERHDATPTGLLVGLHLSDALTDAVALLLGEDGIQAQQEQLDVRPRPGDEVSCAKGAPGPSSTRSVTVEREPVLVRAQLGSWPIGRITPRLSFTDSAGKPID
jgi:hypothetical protein